VAWRERGGPGRSVIGRETPRHGGSPRVREMAGGSSVRTRTIAPRGFAGGTQPMRGGALHSGRGFGAGPGSRGPIAAPSGSRGPVVASSGSRGPVAGSSGGRGRR
jgi:hypothetical protein